MASVSVHARYNRDRISVVTVRQQKLRRTTGRALTAPETRFIFFYDLFGTVDVFLFFFVIYTDNSFCAQDQEIARCLGCTLFLFFLCESSHGSRYNIYLVELSPRGASKKKGFRPCRVTFLQMVKLFIAFGPWVARSFSPV